jgi:hypothetical protein
LPRPPRTPGGVISRPQAKVEASAASETSGTVIDEINVKLKD